MGETRYSGLPAGTGTDYRSTGQRQLAGLGLYQMGARWIDPSLGRWLSADTLVPEPANPQGFNRYSFVLGNPLKYVDPSGHAIQGGDDYDPAEDDWRPVSEAELDAYIQWVLKEFGQVDDLEALAFISDLVASYYPDSDSYLRKMSYVFLGTETYGPATLLSAVLEGGCGGMGREPHDCSENEYYFLDKGFHEDFRDSHNQPYHAWGFIAQTASPGHPTIYTTGRILGMGGNILHEIVQSGMNLDNGWGTSWQDYVLSDSAMAIGLMISSDSVSPEMVGDMMRYGFGVNGPGSMGRLQRLEERWGSLHGSP